MCKIDKYSQEAQYILEEVEDLFAFSLEMFDFEQIIDCSEKLTPEEKQWAKDNLSWRIYVIDKED